MKLILKGQDCGFTWSAAHLLPGHFKCSRMHGHNYVLDLEIESDNLDHGMILDFVEVKKGIRKLIENYDHKIMLPHLAVISNQRYDIGTKMIIERRPNSDLGNVLKISYHDGEAKVDKNYIIPWSDVVMIDNVDFITAENLSVHFRQEVTEVLNNLSGFNEGGSVHVTIYEDSGQGVMF